MAMFLGQDTKDQPKEWTCGRVKVIALVYNNIYIYNT